MSDIPTIFTQRLDAICKAHTAFGNFAALLHARGGYRPTVNVRDAGEAAPDMALLAEQYDLHQERRGDSRRALVIQPETPVAPSPVVAVNRRLTGPGGLILQIDVDDPETPVMVYSANQHFSATWGCAVETGELSGLDPRNGQESMQIDARQTEWLEAFADEVDAAYAKARPPRCKG